MKNEEKEYSQGLEKNSGVNKVGNMGLISDIKERFIIKTLFLENNVIYHGGWVNGKPGGRGKLVYTGQKYYNGEFLNGYFEGFGIYKDIGYLYEGGWKNNKREGQGREEFTNFKQIYEG